MAQQPDGKGAKTERVTFTRPAAERIAKAVRKVEQGDRGAEALRFDRIGGGGSYKLTLGKFTGEWQTNSSKVVTYTAGTTTATAQVFNWCNPALLDARETGSTSVSRYVIFGKVGGTNSAVEIQLRTTQCTASLTLGTLDLTKLPGFNAGVVQLLGHDKQNTASTCSGGLQWYSITTCSTATAA